MNNCSENPMVDFYEKHNISPVHQNISDISAHYIRREKLYRTLGIPPVTFLNRTILEVGPGGGYNALAFFHWGASVDMVEPNSKAQKEIVGLLKRLEIGNERWRLYKSKIENCLFDEEYDIVIAEGFITELNNKDEVIAKLSMHVKKGGVIVVTCLDEISIFFEQVKRLLAWLLTKDTDDFDEKVRILCRAFSSHLITLKFTSRPVKDWVTDEFLNPSMYTGPFSIVDCIESFGGQYELLGSSPSMFTDYSWYKDTGFDSKKSMINQFYCKRHLLIMTEMEESIKTREYNDKLYNAASAVHKLSKELESNPGERSIHQIIDLLEYIGSITMDVDFRIYEAINESISLLIDNDLSAEKIANAGKIAAAFGRAQQYVSMVKKYTVKTPG